MAAITTTPIAVAYRDEGFLSRGINPSDTTIYVGALYKYPNGVKTKQGLDSTGGYAEIAFGKKTEVISFGATSVDATTKETTLTDVRRGLSQTGTTASFAAGTGATWARGAKFRVIDFSNYIHQTMFVDKVNTITGAGAIRGSSTTVPIVRLNNVTTAQREAMVAANGDMVYDTDLGQFYKYEAGAWAAVATGTFANSANGTKGAVDLATAAEVAAGTANDASSSAPNVIPVSIVKTSSTGAANGTVPALNAAVALDRTIGGLGTVTGTTAYTLIANGTTATGATQNLVSAGTSGQVLTSNGANALPTFQATQKDLDALNTDIADGTSRGTSSTDLAILATKTVTTAQMTQGARFRITGSAGFKAHSSTDITFSLRIAGNAVATFTLTNAGGSGAGGEFGYAGEIVIRSTGAGGTAHGYMTLIHNNLTDFGAVTRFDDVDGTEPASDTVAVDTTANREIDLTVTYNTSNAANASRTHQFNVDLILVN